MEAPIKCLLLKNNTLLVSEISEIDVELGDPNCKLLNPFEIIVSDDSYSLKPWMNSFTKQNTFMIHSDSVITIFDPKNDILKDYLGSIE